MLIEVELDPGMNYKYTGQEEVPAVGLYYYRARHYDPGIGRFMDLVFMTEDTWEGRLL